MNEMFVKSSRFKQVCQLLLSLIVASKVFLSTVMVTCILLYYSILFNIITTNQSLAVGNSVPFYLAALFSFWLG